MNSLAQFVLIAAINIFTWENIVCPFILTQWKESENESRHDQTLIVHFISSYIWKRKIRRSMKLWSEHKQQ
jgi:hypothetical protein